MSSDPAPTYSRKVQGQRIGLEDRGRIADAVRAMGVLESAAARRILIDELNEELGGALDLGDADGTDPLPIVMACSRVPGGLRALARVLRLLAGHTKGWRVLASIIDDVLPPERLTAGDYSRLSELLRDLPAATLQAILHLPEFASLPGVSEPPPVDAVDALRRLEALPPGWPGRDDIEIHLLEEIAHRTDGRRYLQLHQAIRALAARHGNELSADNKCDALIAAGFGNEGRQSAPSSLIDIAERGRPEAEVDRGMGRRPLVAGPAIWGGVPPRNRNFVGRAAILLQLQAALRQGSAAAVVPQALQGLGGIGKTQIAIEYAHRFQENYDLVWWIPADDARSIRRSFVSLARRLNLPDNPDVQSTIDATLALLKSGGAHPQWLLVYDSAGEPSDVRPYLAQGPGHVLVTSRIHSWISAAAQIEVDVFTPEESVDLLRKRWPDLDDVHARLLADRLGHLPLALEQAAAVHAETAMPVADYLRLFDASPAEMLSEGTASQYPESVARILKLAFEQLERQSNAAAQLLRVCAFLSNHNISVALLARGRGADAPEPLGETLRDEIKLRRAIRDIAHFALAQLDVGRDFVRVHNLVSTILRDALAPEEQAAYRRVAHSILAYANPGTPDRSETWALHAQITPHVLPSEIVMSRDGHALRVVLDQVRYLYIIGDIAESRALARAAADAWRTSLGADAPTFLLANFHYANATRAIGRYEESRQTNRQTLREMQRILGESHEDTLRVANSVGADLRLLGQFAEALALDVRNVELYRATLGEDDPLTLRAVNNLAVDYRLLGDFKLARLTDEDALRRRVDVLGEEHHEVLSSINGLVWDLLGLGDYSEAMKLHLDRIGSYGGLRAGHSFMLTAKRCLAILLRRTGDYSGSVAEADANYKLAVRQLGSRRERALSTGMTLFNALRANGALVSALRLGEDVFQDYIQVFGEQHVFTSVCALNLAIVYRSAGRADDARTLDRDAYGRLVRAVGEGHPFAVSCLHNMANDEALAGDFPHALELSRKAVQLSSATHGESHPFTLASSANLAADLDAAGDHQAANTLRAKVRVQMQLRLGPEHPETVAMERGRRAESDAEIPPV